MLKTPELVVGMTVWVHNRKCVYSGTVTAWYADYFAPDGCPEEVYLDVTGEEQCHSQCYRTQHDALEAWGNQLHRAYERNKADAQEIQVGFEAYEKARQELGYVRCDTPEGRAFWGKVARVAAQTPDWVRAIVRREGL